MEATLTKPRQSYVFDHKLSREEIEELIKNYDYDPHYYDDMDIDAPDPMFDRFGNPTESMIRGEYEIRNGLTEGPFTLEEYDAMLDELRAEAEAEMNNEAIRTDYAV